MTKELDQTLIDEIITLSKDSDNQLQNKIHRLIELYKNQTKEYKKILKENEYFLKKWDQRNRHVDKNELKKDEMIEQQSRLAAMGEMIDAIAHQWKQPLNAVSMTMEMLKDEFEKESLTNDYMHEADKTINMQIDHMLITLNEFRSFLRPSTKNELFYLQEAFENIQILMKDELISQNINIVLDIDTSLNINANKNELKHLFINLINNSIDAFNEREIKKRNIFIKCYEENKRIYVEFEDNAGGIPEDIIQSIFEPNVTTKQKENGTGIGLYMSKQIVKKNNGLIDVHNSDNGAFFTITLLHPTI